LFSKSGAPLELAGHMKTLITDGAAYRGPGLMPRLITEGNALLWPASRVKADIYVALPVTLS